MIDLEKLVSGSHRNRLFWLLQCTGWMGLAVLVTVFIGLSYASWNEAVLLASVRTAFGFIATCLLRLLYRRMRATDLSLWLIGLSTLLICAMVSALDVLLTINLGNIAGVDMSGTELSRVLQASFLMRWTIYWFWSALYFGINYWLDTQRVQLELAESEVAVRTSELKALKNQINPHFLFNALNSILADAENPRIVRELTFALSDYLRFSLQQHNEMEPLKAELSALENYLKVEQMRFGDKLEYDIVASNAALETPVPNALVQPLLENAIKYGQRSAIRPLHIVIKAEVMSDHLLLTVSNTGEWVARETNDSTGTGLANLHRRLHLLYKSDARLVLIHAGREVVAKVRLPLNGVKVPAEFGTPPPTETGG